MRRSEKGFITSLGLKVKTRPKKYRKLRCSIRNVSMKDLSKIIRDFEKLRYKRYESIRPKHELNGSYFYLAIQPVKCMMRADALNLQIYPVRMEITSKK